MADTIQVRLIGVIESYCITISITHLMHVHTCIRMGISGLFPGEEGRHRSNCISAERPHKEAKPAKSGIRVNKQ